MTYRLVIDVPRLPDLQRRTHWRQKKQEADEFRVLIRCLVGSKGPDEPLKRAKLTCIRRSSVEPDWDNGIASFKPLVDALGSTTSKHRRADVIVDDRPAIVSREYRWEKAPRGKGSCRIIVEEVAPATK